MASRYRAALALTSLLLLGCLQARPHHAARAPRGPVNRTMPAPSEIYSRRALRRARTILQLELLSLREERLERIRKALERRIPIDQLLKEL